MDWKHEEEDGNRHGAAQPGAKKKIVVDDEVHEANWRAFKKGYKFNQCVHGGSDTGGRRGFPKLQKGEGREEQGPAGAHITSLLQLNYIKFHNVGFPPLISQ